MNNLNKCQFIGNLGADPTIHTYDNGDKQASFSIAVNSSYKNKEGVKVDSTEWVNCVARKGLANVIEQYIKKGSKVYVEGSLKTKEYEDKEGVKRYFTEVILFNMEMLDCKKDTTNDQPY